MQWTEFIIELVVLWPKLLRCNYMYTTKKRVAHARPSFYVASIYARLFCNNVGVNCNSRSVNNSSRSVNSNLFSSFQAVRINGSSFFAFTAREHRYAECNSEKEN